MLGKLGAELIGTAAFVFFGFGAAVLFGEAIGPVGVAIAFGLAYGAAMWAVGPVSGGHLNPAVSLGMALAGRIRLRKFVGYAVVQVLGAALGVWLLHLVLAGGPQPAAAADKPLQGFGEGFGGTYGTNAAFAFVAVAAVAFVAAWMIAVRDDWPSTAACAIAATVLAVLGVFGADITETSVNPALSAGLAMVAGETQGLWLVAAAPLLGGGLAGLAFAFGLLRTR